MPNPYPWLECSAGSSGEDYPQRDPANIEKAQEIIERDQKSWTVKVKELEGTQCAPPPPLFEDDGLFCEDNSEDWHKEYWLENTGSGMELVKRKYKRDDVDLKIQVPGGEFVLERNYYDDAWHWGVTRYDLAINYSGSLKLGADIESIEKNGVIYNHLSGNVFAHESFTIVRNTDGTFTWKSKQGDIRLYDGHDRLTAYG